MNRKDIIDDFELFVEDVRTSYIFGYDLYLLLEKVLEILKTNEEE